MKKNTCFIAILLIFLSISTAFGFAGMGNNNTIEPSGIPELTNATESDQDIELMQNLIEIDAVRFETENKLFVRETLAFKNVGEKNFSGILRTWVPDGIEGISVSTVEMMADAQSNPLQASKDGNVISWKASMGANAVPPMFAVEYLLAYEPKGTISRVQTYSKKFKYPTLINYDFYERPGFPPVIIKVTKSEGSSITFIDENRNKITTPDVTQEGNSIISRFSSPQFKEINMEISKTDLNANGIMGYVVIGILILMVFSYPVIRKKSENIQAFEEKIKNSLKREPADEESEEEYEEEIEQETVEEEQEEETGQEADISGMSKSELEEEKNAILSRIGELEKDYSSGDLLDEEYEERKSTYRAALGKINKKLKQSD